ncbi:MAG TPA: acetyl-CoA carboxylase, carboxyltransferase subunit beta [Sedimentisphaerales bacterium]|nr:acetyl-CoA carboxylase, carboxyltransferase subunit beta [Sedimentisphaerales bacterium]
MAKNSKSKWDGFSLKPRKTMPEGLWLACPSCEKMLYRKSVEENLNVCPECNHHFRIDSAARIRYLVDEGSFRETSSELETADPLQFAFRGTTYRERLASDQKKTGLKDAIRIGKAFIKGRGIVLAVMDFGVLGGSLGVVVGEKICLAVEIAIAESLPLVIASASGGARMHEGVVSLDQMAKTSAALARYDDSGGLFISVLTDPTTGGVSASFAMLGDIIVAEPGAEIGFSGRRVIEQTIKVDLPDGFQRSEFLLEHGFVDMIIHRKNMRTELARLIDYCGK